MPQGQGNGQFNPQQNPNNTNQGNFPQNNPQAQIPAQNFQQNQIQPQQFNNQQQFQVQAYPQGNNQYNPQTRNNFPASNAAVQVNNISQLQNQLVKPKKKFGLPNFSKIPKKVLLIGGAIFILILIGSLVFALLNGGNRQTVVPDTKTITFWTRDIDEDVVKEIIAGFENENPTIKVKFEKQSDTNYEDRMTTRLKLKSTNMANIVEIDENWIEDNYLSLAIVSDPTILSRYSSATLKNNTYLNVVFAVPFRFNSLSLAYNVDHIQEIGYTTESFNKLDWTFLRGRINSLTKTEKAPLPGNPNQQYDKITRSGIAIGSPENVTNASKILQLLMIQNDAEIYNATSKQFKADSKFADVMSFYTNFTTSNVWREYLGNDLDGFASGKISMVLVKSEDIDYIQKKNPNLKFATTIPARIAGIQTISFSKSLVIPNYMPNQAESIKFLQYFTQIENGNKLFNGKKSQNTFLPSQTGSLNSIPKTSPFSVYSDINPNAMKFNIPYYTDSTDVMDAYLFDRYKAYYSNSNGIGGGTQTFNPNANTLEGDLNTMLREKQQPIGN